MLCCDITPEGKGCHIRLPQRTEEYVQLCVSGHVTDRFVTGISCVTRFCRDSKGCVRGRRCTRPGQMPLLQPASETIRQLFTLVLSNKGSKGRFLLA